MTCICIVCGKEFRKKGNSTTCSKKCSRDNLKQKFKKYMREYYHNKPMKTEKFCKICGHTFLARKNQVYCSRKCALIAEKQYEKNYGKEYYKKIGRKKYFDKKGGQG